MPSSLILSFSHNAPVYALCLGESEAFVYSGGGDCLVAKWNLRSGSQAPFVLRAESAVYALVLDRLSGLLFIGCSDGKLHAIDTTNRQEVKAWRLHHAGVFNLEIDHSRRRLLAVGGDGVLSVWDIDQLQLLRTVPLSSGKLRQLALSPDNELLAIADNQGPVHVLNAEDYSTITTLTSHADGAMSVAWHPTKPILISGGKDAYLRCWNRSNDFAEILSIAAHQASIYSIVFWPDGTRMATASRDKTIKVWDAQTLDPLRRIEYTDGGHKHSVNKLLIVGDLLVSCGDDRNVQVHRV
jgi:WD40 repeat protein